MTALTIPRDPTGEIIYPGSVKKQVTSDFMFSTSLPSWLTNTSQAGASLGILKVSQPCIGQIDMNSNNGALAQLTLSESMYMQYWGAMRWDLEGVFFNAPASQIEGLYVSFSNTGIGAYVRLGDHSDIKTYEPGSTSHVVDHRFTNRGSKRSNISLLVFPVYKQIYLLENDQVVAHVNAPNMVGSGVIAPNIAYRSMSGYNNKVTISQIRLTVWGNG